MKINTDLIRRWVRSGTNRFFTLLASMGGIYAALDPASQVKLTEWLGAVFQSVGISPATAAGLATVLVGLIGVWLRAKTTKPISER